jgi:hypothetical protein
MPVDVGSWSELILEVPITVKTRELFQWDSPTMNHSYLSGCFCSVDWKMLLTLVSLFKLSYGQQLNPGLQLEAGLPPTVCRKLTITQTLNLAIQRVESIEYIPTILFLYSL